MIFDNVNYSTRDYMAAEKDKMRIKISEKWPIYCNWWSSTL